MERKQNNVHVRQTKIIIVGSEEDKALFDIINAYEEFGNGFERLCAINFRKFCFNMAASIFNLGKIYGIREERARRKKGDNSGNIQTAEKKRQ